MKVYHCHFCDLDYINTPDNFEMISHCRKMGHDVLEIIPYTRKRDHEQKAKELDYARSIMGLYTFKTLLKDTKEILYYQDGVYQFGGEAMIAIECQKIIEDCTTHQVNEVTNHIRRITGENCKREDFNNNFKKIVVNNGILDLNTMKLEEHTSSHLSTVKLPIDYDPKARCPKFLKFLRECHEDNFKNIITTIEGFANILTFKEPNYEICIINYGEGANGKSTFLKIVRGIIGKENTASKSIHSLQYERFAPANLDGKLANIYADISNAELNNLGTFKQLVSGDPLTVEKKGKDPFLMESFAKHLFSCNEMPDIKDNSDGAFRRIYVVKWESQFLPGANRIEDYDKIILENEKSGIFNLLLHNYRRLIKNNGFTHKQSIAAVRETIKLESDKIREFLKECVTTVQNYYLTKDNFFEIYQKWCESKSYEVYSKRKIGDNLPTYGFRTDIKKINGKATRVWLDCSWNKDSDFIKNNLRGLDQYA